jgi:hypothetical protein
MALYGLFSRNRPMLAQSHTSTVDRLCRVGGLFSTTYSRHFHAVRQPNTRVRPLRPAVPSPLSPPLLRSTEPHGWSHLRAGAAGFHCSTAVSDTNATADGAHTAPQGITVSFKPRILVTGMLYPLLMFFSANAASHCWAFYSVAYTWCFRLPGTAGVWLCSKVAVSLRGGVASEERKQQ